MTPRRFPPPWSVEELDECFVVHDHSGQKLAYVYFEEEPGRRSVAKLLTKDEVPMERGGLGPSAKVFAFSAPSHPNADYKILT